MVTKYKYLGLYLDNKLDWSLDTDKLYKRGKNHLFLLRKLRSLDISSKLLQVFCQPVVTSVLFYAAWRGRSEKACKETGQTSEKSWLCNWSHIGHTGEGVGEMQSKYVRSHPE